MKRLLLFLLPALVLFACAAGDAYYAVFEQDPGLRSEQVLSKGVEIGRIEGKELTPKGTLLLKIVVEDKYREMMRTTGVFYVKNGILEYALSGAPDVSGAQLAPGAKIPGFAREEDYLAFRAKAMLSGWADSAMDYLNNLLDEAKPKEKPAAPKQEQAL